MAKFNIGQSVRLKGQPYSPIMTVSSLGSSTLSGKWWKTDTLCFKSETFDFNCLELVPENELKEIMEKASKA
jgi:uncharacterized protein YodC (DUF2158 family)